MMEGVDGNRGDTAEMEQTMLGNTLALKGGEKHQDGHREVWGQRGIYFS